MKQPLQQPTSVAEEIGPPAEEAIKAFLEYLVDPLLPLKQPRGTPPLPNQEKVAKQMHAVVLLYNYYQRKRHAQAEYLDFMSFCNLVVTLKPVLASYMPSMQRSLPTDSENQEVQFSVTEKAIVDACTISTSLDVSRDIPDVNEWMVSKVAVFLVNSSKENCALSFSSHTDGVWSIFEKSIDNCVENQENQEYQAQSRSLHKRKRKRKQPTGEPDLQQLVFSALKEAIGIERSHLTILERHVTYSLDKERTSACCFIIECRSTNQEFEFSVRDTIESLQGPLVKKISGNWTLTQLIEYYNVLPYAGIMSSWFSRQFPLISSELLNASFSENCCGNDAEYKKLDFESMDNSLSELVDVNRRSAENLEHRDNSISYDFTNAKVQEDACQRSYMSTQSKGDSTDAESDKTYDDDNLAKNRSIESRDDYENGAESESVMGMDVNIRGKPKCSEVLCQRSKEESMAVNVIESNKYSFTDSNGQEDSCEKRSMTIQGEVDKAVESDRTGDYENLSKSKSNESKSDYHNEPKRENVKGLDLNLSGKLSGPETHPQSSKGEPMDNVQSSSKNPNDYVKCTQQSSKWRGNEESSGRPHSENKRPGPFSTVSANDGCLKETEQPSGKQIRPSIKEVDGEESTSTNSVGEEVCTFNSNERIERPAKEVKDLLKSHDAGESSLTCKRETNSLVLNDRKVLQLESGGPHVANDQESSGILTNKVNSTTISLSGDANAENKLKSVEKLAKEKDSKLCKSDSRCESISDLLCSRKDLQLNSGNIDNQNILEEGNLPNEARDISAPFISKTNDTGGDGSKKPDLKLIAQKGLECGTTEKKPYLGLIAQKDLECSTTDKKPDLGLSTRKTSKCGKMDSSLQKDVNMPIADSPSSPKGSDDSPVTCLKEKEAISSTKSVIVYNAKRKRSRNQHAPAPTGCTNTEMETAKGAKSCNADSRDKIATNLAIMPIDLGTPVANPAINPDESVHSASNNLLSVLALKETELSQAALGVLLQKKHELQEIQDQITLCDQSIQKILDGNENSLVLTIDTIINCCNDFLNNKTEVQSDSNNQAGSYDATQLLRPKTISKPFLFTGSASQLALQKLENSNANKCATAGQFMSSSTGNFHGGVAAGEMDLKCPGEGSSVPWTSCNGESCTK